MTSAALSDQDFRIEADRALEQAQHALLPLADEEGFEVELQNGSDPGGVADGLEPTFALSCQLADPCWEGGAARALALAASSVGRTEESLDWITSARQRCLRETDSFAALHAAILETELQVCLDAGLEERARHAARALVSVAARGHMDAFLAPALAALDSGSAPA